MAFHFLRLVTGRTEVIHHFEDRFSPLQSELPGTTVAVDTARINAADAETLLRWSERILSASTLDAVFAE